MTEYLSIFNEKINQIVTMDLEQIEIMADECITKISNYFLQLLMVKDTDLHNTETQQQYLSYINEILYIFNKILASLMLFKYYSSDGAIKQKIDNIISKIHNKDIKNIKNKNFYNKNKIILEHIKNNPDHNSKFNYDHTILNILINKQINIGINLDNVDVINTVISINKEIEEIEYNLNITYETFIKLITLRNHKSKMLGYSNYCEFIIKNQFLNKKELLIGLFNKFINSFDKTYIEDIKNIILEYNTKQSNITYEDLHKIYLNIRQELFSELPNINIPNDMLIQKIINICKIFFKVNIIKKKCYINKELEAYALIKNNIIYGYFVLDCNNTNAKTFDIIPVEWYHKDKNTLPIIFVFYNQNNFTELNSIIEFFNSVCTSIQFILSEYNSKYSIINSLSFDDDFNFILNKVFLNFIIQNEVLQYIISYNEKIINKIQAIIYLDDIYKLFTDLNICLIDNIINSNKNIDDYEHVLSMILDNNFFQLNTFTINNYILSQLCKYGGNYVNKIFIDIIAHDIYYNKLENINMIFDIKIGVDKKALLHQILNKEIQSHKFMENLQKKLIHLINELSFNDNCNEVYKLFKKEL